MSCLLSARSLCLLLLPCLSVCVYEEAEKQLEMQTAIMVNQMALAKHAEIISSIANVSLQQHSTACCYNEGFSRGVDILANIKDSLASLLDKDNQHDRREGCPYPYKEVVYECFYAHPKKLTWHQARRVCRGMGGDLAEPKNVYALQAYLAEIYGPSYFWVGGSDLDVEGNWTWISGRSISNHDWLFARPDNLGGDEHCLEIVMSDYPNLFNDETCSILQRFICQYRH